MGRRVEQARVGRLLGRKGEREEIGFLFFSFYISFLIFKTEFKYESNQVSIGFQIHFLIQIKMSNFGKFSKII